MLSGPTQASNLAALPQGVGKLLHRLGLSPQRSCSAPSGLAVTELEEAPLGVSA